MKHLLLTCIILIAAIAANAQKSKNKTDPHAVIYEKAEIKFDTISHDFKEILEGQVATHVFIFYNIGKEPLIVSDAHAGCSCTVSDYTKEPIMPGKSGTVTVKYNTTGRMGMFTKSLTITSNAFQSPVVTLTISGNVIAAPQEVH